MLIIHILQSTVPQLAFTSTNIFLPSTSIKHVTKYSLQDGFSSQDLRWSCHGHASHRSNYTSSSCPEHPAHHFEVPGPSGPSSEHYSYQRTSHRRWLGSFPGKEFLFIAFSTILIVRQQIISGFADIVSTATTAIAQMSSMPPVAAGTDANNIFDAFREVRPFNHLIYLLLTTC